MTAQISTVEDPSDNLVVVDVVPFQPPTVTAVPVPHAGNPVVQDSSEKTSVNEVEAVELPAHVLTDQTNFLPTRQVITVFCGLSVALACAFLDQTMWAFITSLSMCSSTIPP